MLSVQQLRIELNTAGADMINFLSAIFEEMDEMVYIADMDSHEIVYMNRQLRESLGYFSEQEYAHKKCYKVLQGEIYPVLFAIMRRYLKEVHLVGAQEFYS